MGDNVISNMKSSVKISPILLSLVTRLREIDSQKYVFVRSKDDIFCEFGQLKTVKDTSSAYIHNKVILADKAFYYFEKHVGDFGVIFRDNSITKTTDEEVLKKCLSKIETKLGFSKFKLLVIVRNDETKYFKILADGIDNFIMLELGLNDFLIVDKEIDKVINKFIKDVSPKKKETKKEEIAVVNTKEIFEENHLISFDKTISDVV